MEANKALKDCLFAVTRLTLEKTTDLTIFFFQNKEKKIKLKFLQLIMIVKHHFLSKIIQKFKKKKSVGSKDTKKKKKTTHTHTHTHTYMTLVFVLPVTTTNIFFKGIS